MAERGEQPSKREHVDRRVIAMEGMGKFDKYTEFWRDIERAREDIHFAQKGRELIARLREKGQ
jgi:hypothetical protein